MSDGERIIVKVQVPMATNETPMALIYNKDRSFQATAPINADIKRQMRGRFKAFFYAMVKGKDFYLGENEAPWQEW